MESNTEMVLHGVQQVGERETAQKVSRMPRQKPGKSRQDYQTPPEFLTAIKRRLGIQEFQWDLAASRETSIAQAFFSENPYTDAFNSDWNALEGWLWCNPPFSNIAPWAEKAWTATIPTYGLGQPNRAAKIAMLVPASVGSNWWANFVDGKAYVIFPRPRLTFVGETAPYPKDVALLLYQPVGVGYECWRWKNC